MRFDCYWQQWPHSLQRLRCTHASTKYSHIEVPNFSVSVVQLANRWSAGTKFVTSITERMAHISDQPSGTALYLRDCIIKQAPQCLVDITSHRIPDAVATHTITITKPEEALTDTYSPVPRFFCPWNHAGMSSFTQTTCRLSRWPRASAVDCVATIW